MDSKVSHTWTDLLTYLFAYALTHVNKHYTLFFLLLHFVETKWAHSTGSFVLRDPEHEALFFIEKVLHTKNREALGVRASQFLA